jgi:hypothetical protein
LDVYKVTEVEGKLPDIMALNTLWEWGGVSFGNAFTLFLSLRELMSNEDVSSVRMWGKIYGSEKDYYIVEADGENLVEEENLSDDEEEEVVDEEDEIAKAATNPIPFVPIEVGGANKYVYYVSHSGFSLFILSTYIISERTMDEIATCQPRKTCHRQKHTDVFYRET